MAAREGSGQGVSDMAIVQVNQKRSEARATTPGERDEGRGLPSGNTTHDLDCGHPAAYAWRSPDELAKEWRWRAA